MRCSADHGLGIRHGERSERHISVFEDMAPVEIGRVRTARCRRERDPYARVYTEPHQEGIDDD